jgi:AcrR family transcriptional regulator
MTSLEKAGLPVAGSKPVSLKKRRPRRPSLGNEAFLDKALDLFLERGFERTSIEEITATAGMAKRTVYLRYGDKKSLFKAALERAIEDWIVPVERLRAAETADLEQSLLAIGRILLDNILSPAGLRLLRVTNAESGHMPEIGAYTVQRGTEPTIAYLTDLFRRHLGRNGTDFPEAREAGQAFLNLVVGGPAVDAAWGVTQDTAAIDRHVRYSVRWFLHGLLPEARQSASGGSITTLEDDNLRLKKLLAETMIQLDSARERLEHGGKPHCAEQETR